MENFFGVGSVLFFIASMLWAFLSTVDKKSPESKNLWDGTIYLILVAIFCRIAVVTYQMITIAELLQ